jgi:hypothetical protein
MLHSLDVIMEKVVRDGKVAVLVSPGFGAGWYTWNREENSEVMLFDPEVVAWVEGGKVGPAPSMEEKYGWEYFYDGGAGDLVVRWVPVGAKFRIDEYDGAESLVLESEEKWVIA